MANAYRSVLTSQGSGGGAPVNSLVADTTDAKTVFNVGENFSSNGLVVNAEVGTALEGDVVADCTLTPPSSPFVEGQIGYHDVGIDYFGTKTSYQIRVKQGVDIVPWSTGTDAQIAAMLDAHYAGDINLYEIPGWEIGAKRNISLPAISPDQYNADCSFYAQTVSMMLLNKGGKTLTTPISGQTECAFVVGLDRCLQANNVLNYNNNNNNQTWGDTLARSWCNNTFRNAIPSGIRDIFKQHVSLTSAGGGSSTIVTTDDYFAFMSEVEAYGTTVQSIAGEGTRFDYYKNSSTSYPWRKSQYNDSATSYVNYGLRSPYYVQSQYTTFNIVSAQATNYPGTTTGKGGAYVSPIGVI